MKRNKRPFSLTADSGFSRTWGILFTCFLILIVVSCSGKTEPASRNSNPQIEIINLNEAKHTIEIRTDEPGIPLSENCYQAMPENGLPEICDRIDYIYLVKVINKTKHEALQNIDVSWGYNVIEGNVGVELRDIEYINGGLSGNPIISTTDENGLSQIIVGIYLMTHTSKQRYELYAKIADQIATSEIEINYMQ